MDKKSLLEKLEIEEGGKIEYFEQLAELLEMPEALSFELFFAALGGLDSETAGELTENYFEELVDALPDDENELVSLMDTIEQNILLLAENLEDDSVKLRYAQQLFKFREWLVAPGNAQIDGSDASVLEAIFAAREDKLTGEDRTLDFSDALDYELDDTEYSLGSFEKIEIVED